MHYLIICFVCSLIFLKGSVYAADTISLELKNTQSEFSNVNEIELILIFKNNGKIPVRLLNTSNFGCGHPYEMKIDDKYIQRGDATKDCIGSETFGKLDPKDSFEIRFRLVEGWSPIKSLTSGKLKIEYNSGTRIGRDGKVLQNYWIGNLVSNEINLVIKK